MPTPNIYISNCAGSGPPEDGLDTPNVSDVYSVCFYLHMCALHREGQPCRGRGHLYSLISKTICSMNEQRPLQ